MLYSAVLYYEDSYLYARTLKVSSLLYSVISSVISALLICHKRGRYINEFEIISIYISFVDSRFIVVYFLVSKNYETQRPISVQPLKGMRII